MSAGKIGEVDMAVGWLGGDGDGTGRSSASRPSASARRRGSHGHPEQDHAILAEVYS